MTVFLLHHVHAAVLFSVAPCTVVLDQRDEGHGQYADERRRQSDMSSRRERRGE